MTAVTVQNSLGVKGFHEIPVDVVAGQISAVASDIGIEAAKTGMLASTAIIETVVATWRAERLAGTVPLVVDPVCASNVGEPLLHPSALDAMRDDLIPLATLVTPNLDEVRLLVGIDVVDEQSQRDAARALHALGPQWALVKGGHLRNSPVSSDLLFDGSDFVQFAAARVDTRHDHGAGDTLAAAVAAALAHGYTVPGRGQLRQGVGHRVHPGWPTRSAGDTDRSTGMARPNGLRAPGTPAPCSGSVGKIRFGPTFSQNPDATRSSSRSLLDARHRGNDSARGEIRPKLFQRIDGGQIGVDVGPPRR